MAIVSGRSWGRLWCQGTGCIHIWNNRDRLERKNKRSTVVTTVLLSPVPSPFSLPWLKASSCEPAVGLDCYSSSSSTYSIILQRRGPAHPAGLGDCFVGRMGYSTICAQLQDREDDQQGRDSFPSKLRSRKKHAEILTHREGSPQASKSYWLIEGATVHAQLTPWLFLCYHQMLISGKCELILNFL